MGEIQPGFTRRFYGIIIAVLVLQVLTIGVAVRYGIESARRDTTLLERTETMVDQMLPSIHKDLSGVSNTVSGIKGDVTLLRKQVDHVDQHVGRVGSAVARVGREVEGMNQSMTAFFSNTSGLIWGHSLNPYVLMALLVTILLSVPLFGAVYSRRRRREASVSHPVASSPATLLAKRLDDLSQLIEQMREQQKSPEATVEMKKLLDETERFIRDAQAELSHLSEAAATRADVTNKSGQTLH